VVPAVMAMAAEQGVRPAALDVSGLT